MGLLNIDNIKSNQNRIGVMAIILTTILIFGGYLVRLIYIIDGNSTYELTRPEFIRIFNVVLSLLGIVSCLLCYRSNKKQELFFIAVIYIVFLVDISISNFQNHRSNNVSTYMAMGTSAIRVVLCMIIAISNNKLNKIILNNKVKSVIAILLITLLVTGLEYKYGVPVFVDNIELIFIYNFVTFLIYVAIAFTFFLKSVLRDEYIYGVIASCTLMFATKSIYAIYIHAYNIPEIKLTSVSITYIGFIVFIIGLFLELGQNIKKIRKLDEQKELFFNIFEENKHSNVVVCDENYNILYYNKKFIKDNYNILEQNNFFSDKDLSLTYIHQRIDEIEEELSNKLYYHKIRKVDGGKVFDISIQVLNKNSNEYRVIEFRDVSETYNMERALAQMENMKQEEQMKNEFFANISHELKTPLNIIYSTFQLLSLRTDKDEFKDLYTKYKQSIDINCKRMLRLIDNIVDMTKFDVGYKVASFRNFDVVRLVEDITISVVDFAKHKNINVIFDTDVEELFIKLDVDMLERIMLNLLSNAIKFTSSGGDVLVKIHSDDEIVRISVIDNGVGINKKIQESIFERFSRGDSSLRRETEGSGIGLSLVKSLVNLLDGDISVKSDGVNGSEFILELKNELYDEGEISFDNYQVDNQKIKLEFSDIYEIYDYNLSTPI